MSDQITLAAETRTEFGKGFARRARAAGKIPAVIYGHGSEPVHIFLPGHDTMMALKHSNALLNIELDGKSELVIVKDVQTEPVRRIIEHVDLLIVKKGEKVAVDVPVHVVGESFAGTIHVLEHASLHLEAEATHLPEVIEVSVEGLEDGAKIHASEIVLPKGAVLVTEGDTLVVSVSTPRGAGAAEGEAAEATETAAE
ncbi:50S ribosomal protein L25/general stress protein Ctc [Demequina soli]|uniref:50S ribosomal protein L25/general stress protein Ctc n=1 Tax=Demequina soli TaxID=1638987 RepID=UPI0007802059|nr:50S ribosomal protein L25/general stress protein Ctc [Demequina soli]